MKTKIDLDPAIKHLLYVPPICELPESMQEVAINVRNQITPESEAIKFVWNCLSKEVISWYETNLSLHKELNGYHNI